MHSLPWAKPFTFGLLVLLGVSVASCQSASIRLHLREGNRLYNQQKYEEAAVEYEKILKIDPQHWEGNYLMSITYMALFHPGSVHPKDQEYARRAIEQFETTLALPAPDEESLLKVRTYYLGLLTLNNRADKAQAYLEQLLREKPDDQEIMGQLGSLYLKRGEYAKAASLYEARATANPQDKVAWYSLGVLFWDQSHKTGATLPIEEREAIVARGIAALERAIAIDENYFDALSYINLLYREKGNYLGETGRVEEAQQAFATADEYRGRAMALRAVAGGSEPAQGS